MAKIKDGHNPPLTSLQRKMLPALTLPMERTCPTALRYALAKYDASAVADAYEGLYELFKRDLLENP